MLVRFAIVPPRDCPALARGEENERLFNKPRTPLLHNWAGWRSWEALKKMESRLLLSPWCLCFLHAVCTNSF